MKTVLLFFCLIISLSTKAQFTLTSASNPSPGDKEIRSPVNFSAVTTPSDGANVFWNYSNLTLQANSTFTNSFVAGSSVQCYSVFTGANLGMYNSSSANTMLVFKAGASGYEDLGIISMPNCFNNIDAKTIMSFPFTYGDNLTDLYNEGTASGTVDISGNGTGTLALPGFTLTDVLKITTITNENFSQGSAYIIDHNFYSHASKFSLLTIRTGTYTQNSFPSFIQSATINSSLHLGLKESTSKTDITIYPNPVNNANITIKISDNSNKEIDISLLNTLNQTLKVNNYTNLHGIEDILNFEMEQIPPGIYFLQIKNTQNNYIKKIIVE